MAETVLVTEKEFAKAQRIFRLPTGFVITPAPGEEARLSAAVLKARARAVVVGVECYTGPLYHALREAGEGRGALIARFGVGHDGVNKTLARENNILVCNTPGVLDISVAEHAFWLMGNLARRVAQLDSRIRGGSFIGETGSELHGKLLGVLGFGPIGRRVATMGHFGFGMRVWAAGTSSVEQLEAREQRSIAEIQAALGLELYTNDTAQLFRECDFLSIHLPATPATRHFINSHRLGLMKPTTLLVNTARGSVIDEAALHEALTRGLIAGAALDVFENEPYQPVAPGMDLRQLPNVTLTPHVGSNTREANQRMAEACLANLNYFFAGDLQRLTQVGESR